MCLVTLQGQSPPELAAGVVPATRDCCIPAHVGGETGEREVSPSLDHSIISYHHFILTNTESETSMAWGYNILFIFVCCTCSPSSVVNMTRDDYVFGPENCMWF